ncbi:MAG TPA: DUF6188 family protein [Emticicia sp.]
MKIKEIGRYFELPIVGLKINQIIFTGRITLVFDDDEKSYLQLDSEFLVTQYNQTNALNPTSKEALLLFYDHFNQPIKEAKADRNGNLWLTFNNGTELQVEDGPYENWHYTKRSIQRSSDTLSIHGGVGRTIIIE